MREKFLEDDILRLRAVNPEDANIMWEIENDSTQWIENCMAAPLSNTIITDYALSYDADPFSAKQLRLIAELKEDKNVIGIVDLYDISAINRNAFVGIYIIPKFRNEGFGERALILLEKFTFSLLNLNNIGAKIVIDNKESVKLFKKLNFSECGCLPNWIVSGKESKDLLFFSKHNNL